MKNAIIFTISLIVLFSILFFINISSFDSTTLFSYNLDQCEYYASELFNLSCNQIKYVVDTFHLIFSIPVIALLITFFVKPIWKSLFIVLLSEIIWIVGSEILIRLVNIPVIYAIESDFHLRKSILGMEILTVFMIIIGLLVPTLIIFIRKDLIKEKSK